MLGYGKYWTAGFGASQWYEITHYKEFGWAEFYFIFAGVEYDNHCQSWGMEFYFMGLRFWACISDPWGKHPTDVETAIEEFMKDEPSAMAPKKTG
jgi:hypothetical protein